MRGEKSASAIESAQPRTQQSYRNVSPESLIDDDVDADAMGSVSLHVDAHAHEAQHAVSAGKPSVEAMDMISPESLFEEPVRLNLDKSDPFMDLTIQSEFIYDDVSPIRKQPSVSPGASPTDNKGGGENENAARRR